MTCVSWIFPCCVNSSQHACANDSESGLSLPEEAGEKNTIPRRDLSSVRIHGSPTVYTVHAIFFARRLAFRKDFQKKETSILYSNSSAYP